MPSDPETRLASGRKALEAGDWKNARDRFREALESGETPEALCGLGEALWWLGDLEGTVSTFERAYSVSRSRGDHLRAAEAALRNVLHARFYLGNETAASGWVARARRVIEEHDLDALRGELLVIQSCCAGDPSAGERDARRALEWARRAGDPDLELCSLSSAGAALVRQGRVGDGLELLNEAWTGALSGEGRRLETTVFTGCDYMTSCAHCAAFERAVECLRAAERFSRRHGCPFLYSECRLVYCEVLLATGNWSQAEKELRMAIERTRATVPVYHAWALAGLADLRLSQGGMEEAERLVQGYEGYPRTVPVIVRMHLLRGAFDAAALAARRRLDVVGDGQLESALLLELLGEAEAGQGCFEEVARIGRHLVDLGSTRNCRVMRARGERLLGRASLGADPAAGRRRFDEALAAFVELNMPYEAARTRLLLAETLCEVQPELAAGEARAALKSLDGLGAGREADLAADLLRRLGVRSGREGSRGLHPLTRREREVLALLGEGLSNPEIARRLFISPKTAEHHVCSILSKTGFRSRAAAAAASVRQFSAKTVKK